jgi:signal transduction histidine kinase
VTCGLAYVVYAVVRHLGSDPPPWQQTAGVGGWLLVGLGAAELARVRAAQRRAEAQVRAERDRAAAEEERAAGEQQRRQASEERLRIARELHDVLGHHLSLISVQAGVGLHLMDTRPEQARTALVAIRQASAEALAEVRSVLAALRPDEESLPRSPAPGLAAVGALVEDARAAGLTVVAEVNGADVPVAAEVERAAYRVVQEALTNVRRHAGPAASVRVVIDAGPGGLAVSVEDDGAGGGPGGSGSTGSGIAGMRARIAAVGGTLRAGPRPTGGFEVVAHLPMKEQP